MMNDLNRNKGGKMLVPSNKEVNGNDELLEDEDYIDVEMDDLYKNNSFENPTDRSTAERVIEYIQKGSLEIYGGYPLWKEVSFTVNDVTYSVIAFGVSESEEGKNAIMGMFFVKEDEERKE